jgi:hypothetical protein
LKLEGFGEVEDAMFWLCSLLWKAVDGLMGEDNMRQGQEDILIPPRSIMNPYPKRLVMIAVACGARFYTAALDCGGATPKDNAKLANQTIVGQSAGSAPWREVLEWINYFSVQSLRLCGN